MHALRPDLAWNHQLSMYNYLCIIQGVWVAAILISCCNSGGLLIERTLYRCILVYCSPFKIQILCPEWPITSHMHTALNYHGNIKHLIGSLLTTLFKLVTYSITCTKLPCQQQYDSLLLDGAHTCQVSNSECSNDHKVDPVMCCLIVPTPTCCLCC